MRTLIIATAAAAALLSPPAFSQRPSQGTTSIPDFSGTWVYPFCCGFGSPLSGPGPVVNKSRQPQPNGADGLPWRGNSPPLVSSTQQFVGDYTNQILKPQAAEAVKKHGDIELSGVPNATPRNQCWPEGVPFIFGNMGIQLIQQPGKVTILYEHDHQVRHVRMNEPHRAQLTPSWYGDSVGHYEGDTLVIDTFGIKTGPFSMIDWYGTPYSDLLHVIERYRLIEYEAAKQVEEKLSNERVHMPLRMSGATGLMAAAEYKGKALQLQFTVEDQGVFTMPWSATITYWRSFEPWPEYLCAENLRSTYVVRESAVPRAEKPDF